MVTNRRTEDTDGADFYPTPAWATHALMLHETFEGSIWEPGCGDGAMGKVIHEYNQNLTCTDIYMHGYGEHDIDFLALSNEYDGSIDNIITNPPYNIADEFLAKALATATKKVAFLVRLAYMEGQGRYESVYRTRPPSRVWVFSERITFYKKGATVKGSGTTAYGWFVWSKEEQNTTTELRWLPPGYKKKYGNWSPPAQDTKSQIVDSQKKTL
jgi:hypothetical protein